jgi:hypothetical protein
VGIRKRQALAVLCVLALSAPDAGRAVITFSQLADDVFVVSHRVKLIGSRGQAMRLAYTKAASLCIAAGYSHFEILQQESQAGSEYEIANASIRVKLSSSGGGERLECAKSAEAQYIEEASNKLQRIGYQPPAVETAEAVPAAAEGSGAPPPGMCTVEQIVSMVTAGFDVEQIKAACPENP